MGRTAGPTRDRPLLAGVAPRPPETAMSDGARPPKRDAARLQHSDGAALDLPADERLDRMLGDQELLLRLQLSSYAPRDWLPVAAEFARYGLGVLEPWIGTGRIFGKVYD